MSRIEMGSIGIGTSRIAVGAVLGTLALAAPLEAQDAARLDSVEAAADRGERATARTQLELIADGSQSHSRGDMARLHFLRARLMSDVDSAEVQYLSAAIDGEGPYASRARLRLAQLRLAHGDHEGAQRHLDKLAADDPRGPINAIAWVWRARVAEARGDASAACFAWDAALASLPADRPEREQARENRSRCESGQREPGEVETFTVQLGAFGTEESAIRLRDGAATTGVAVRVEPPHGAVRVYRVRAGRFGSREDADRLASRFREAGYEAVVVPEEP